MFTTLVIPDQHAHPDHDNSRAEALGEMMYALRPDAVINLGDAADMPSLREVDKGSKEYQNQNYRRDIDAHLDFQEKLWYPYRKNKKRRPYTVFTVGNHEQRINKLINRNPVLEGAIDMDDLELDTWYDLIVPYNGSTPGVFNDFYYDYAHYVISGVMGKPIGGVHQAYTMNKTRFKSTIVGHSHVLDYNVQTDGHGDKLQSISAGCFIDYKTDWAGEAQKFWWSGVVILRDDSPEFVPIEAIL
jgi:hypothetical protein